MTVCDKFEPTILEGQLCYSLEINKLGEKPTKSGKTNGLFLLLDPNPYGLNSTGKNIHVSDTEEQSFKIYFHTLAQFATYGSGSYWMSALKKMTGTKGFKKLPDHQKKCSVHNREECQTEKYLEGIQGECNCTPWSMQSFRRKNQVMIPKPLE